MIDWDQVAQLREEIGDDAFVEVADAFLAEVEGVLGDLRAGRVVADRMEDTYHGLKGSALNLGLSDFAGICARAEIAARAGAALPNPEWLLDVFRTEKTTFLRDMKSHFAA